MIKLIQTITHPHNNNNKTKMIKIVKSYRNLRISFINEVLDLLYAMYMALSIE